MLEKKTQIKNFEEYSKKLEKIITREIALRDPSISIVHINVEKIKEIYIQFRLMCKNLKEKHTNWNYFFINIEEILFNILKKIRYIDKQKFVLNCERETLAKDMQESIKQDLIEEVEKKIEEIKVKSSNNKSNNMPPPFLILLNMHSTYPYIQTKDIIAQIINQKGIWIIIFYLQGEKHITFEKEVYKDANYNVYTEYLLG